MVLSPPSRKPRLFNEKSFYPLTHSLFASVLHFIHMTYIAKTFNLPVLEGISEKQIKVHLALYEGYVKHVNLMTETLKGYAAYGDKATEGDKYAIAELRRRFAFEFDGMRMHEYYFAQLEKGGSELGAGSALANAVKEKYGEKGLEAHIREVAGSRGIGWVVVYTDPVGKTIHTVFVADHEVGQLAGLPVLLALDLWEHAYMVDYVPAEKKNYIDAFFLSLNWSVIEKRFDATI
ncbi:superoxide dismutase [Candidatus Kaiserbacteria bacterium]|nr:superoxide dismutase [Candidatus Kaiserbacteria bacterium]